MKRGKSRMRARSNLLKQYQLGEKARAKRRFDRRKYDGHITEEE
jgi:hypothetical protein